MTLFRILRNVTIAGAAGLLCGKGYSTAKTHPQTVVPIVKLSAASGLAGALLGWGISAYRNLPTHIYAISLGANFALTSGVFFSIRHGTMMSLDASRNFGTFHWTSLPQLAGLRTLVHDWCTTEHAQYISSTTAGGIAGILASLVSRHGLKSIILTGLGGITCGLCGQFLYNRIKLWRRRKAMEIHFPELVEQKGKQWTFESMQERFLNFWHQNSEGGKLDIEIALLEDSIRGEKQKIAELDEALLRHGVEVKGEPAGVKKVEPSCDSRPQDDFNNLNNRTEDSTDTIPN